MLLDGGEEQASYLVWRRVGARRETDPPHSYGHDTAGNSVFLQDDNDSSTVTRGVTITNLWPVFEGSGGQCNRLLRRLGGGRAT